VDPNLPKLLNDIVLPSSKKLNADSVDPRRENPRMLTDEPSCKKSSTDMDPLNLAEQLTEMPDPIRVKLRMLTELPILEKSIIEAALMRAKLRNDKLEVTFVAQRMLRCFPPTLTLLRREHVLPNRTKDLIESDDPKIPKS
jgi:hypothetical protein